MKSTLEQYMWRFTNCLPEDKQNPIYRYLHLRVVQEYRYNGLLTNWKPWIWSHKNVWILWVLENWKAVWLNENVIHGYSFPIETYIKKPKVIQPKLTFAKRVDLLSNHNPNQCIQRQGNLIISETGISYPNINLKEIRNWQTVKIRVLFENKTSETFWVRDIKVSGNDITGYIDNDLVRVPMKDWDRISFKKENVLEIFKY